MCSACNNYISPTIICECETWINRRNTALGLQTNRCFGETGCHLNKVVIQSAYQSKTYYRLVFPILFYGSESWTSNIKDHRKIILCRFGLIE